MDLLRTLGPKIFKHCHGENMSKVIKILDLTNHIRRGYTTISRKKIDRG